MAFEGTLLGVYQEGQSATVDIFPAAREARDQKPHQQFIARRQPNKGTGA